MYNTIYKTKVKLSAQFMAQRSKKGPFHIFLKSFECPTNVFRDRLGYANTVSQDCIYNSRASTTAFKSR